MSYYFAKMAEVVRFFLGSYHKIGQNAFDDTYFVCYHLS